MRRSSLGLFAAAVAFLLPVVFSPLVYGIFWTPPAALLPLVAAVGLPLLVTAAWRGDRAARLAVAFLVVAGLSAVLSPNHTTALFGLYNWGTGWLFVAACAGAWAVGAALDEPSRRLVEQAVLTAVLVNAVVGLLEMVTDLQPFQLGLYQGRSPGLLGNPVHLGGLAAAGVALVVARVARRPVWAVAVVVLAAAVETSGTRIALVILAAVVAWGGVRHGRRVAAVLTVAAALGFAGGWGLTHLGGGVSLASRVTQEGAEGGISGRVATWRSGLKAALHRPLLGIGPGQFATATTKDRTAVVVRTNGPDVYFTDAHNLVVEYATTTGLLGVALLVGWLAVAARRSSGPLLVLAGAIAVLQLVEPQNVRLTPVALLALGAAGAAGPPVPIARRATLRVVTAALAAVALGAAALLLLGDYHQRNAYLDFTESDAKAAMALLPRWPFPAILRSHIHTFRAEGRGARKAAEQAAALYWRRVALARDDSDPALWNAVADLEAIGGDRRGAERDFRHALALDPVSVRALNGLGRLALDSGDRVAARAWLRRSLRILPLQPATRRMLHRADVT